MSLQEIESAIRDLPQKDQAQLINDLPTLMPALGGDAIWKLITVNPQPRPKLSALIVDLDAQYTRKPESFEPIKDQDFNL